MYITSYFGLTGSKNVNINNVKMMIKRVRKYSKDIPVAVGFGVKTPSQVKQVSKYADGVICGSTIVNKVAQGHKKRLKGKKLATFVSSYVKKLSKGIKK